MQIRIFEFLNQTCIMIPNLSPPTDNLYKFIALFGLAILLFSFYKSSEVFDVCTKTKKTIEDLRNEIHLISHMKGKEDKHLSDTTDIAVSPFSVKDLSSDLHQIAMAVENSPLNDSIKFEIDTKIRKMQVEMDVLSIRNREYYFITGFGLILMFFGFTLWYRKDQVHRDRRIKYEQAIEKKKIIEENEELKIKNEEF